MLELYKKFQATGNKEFLADLINHKYILSLFYAKINTPILSQIDIEELKNNLFIYLLTRKDKIKFDHENKFKAYLSSTIRGIVSTEIERANKHNKKISIQQEHYDYYILDEIPAVIKEFIKEDPAFYEYIVCKKTLTEISKKYNTNIALLSIRFKELRKEIKDYYTLNCRLTS